MAVSTPNESGRIGQRQRALVILHQMIDDAFKGKRQFLSGNINCNESITSLVLLTAKYNMLVL